MTDDISNKVINIFQRHRRGETFHFEVEEGGELIISPDGFNYVSLKQDVNGQINGNNGERVQMEVAEVKHYIVKMMEVHHEGQSIRLNNYYIPGERLEEFMLSLANRPGRLLEIKQFIPDMNA
ncbi:MAG TPA: hypothetical protein V6C52_12140 [Coleofasciculaceae cyanobacterium]|jgi:hypothetical protein